MNDNEFRMIMDMLKELANRNMIQELYKIGNKISNRLNDSQRDELAKFMITEKAESEKRIILKRELEEFKRTATAMDYF